MQDKQIYNFSNYKISDNQSISHISSNNDKINPKNYIENSLDILISQTKDNKNMHVNNDLISNEIQNLKRAESYIQQKSKINEHPKSVKSFLYGYIAGLSGIVVSHPFDTMKTCIQEGKKINYNLRSLYRGVFPPLLGVGLEKAIVFGTFENSKHFTNSDAISGAISGFTASFIVTPFERIKIILQIGGDLNLRNLKKLSIGYLYQGFSATLTRETPGFAIYFSVYNFLKNNDTNISAFRSFMYGALSGTFAWIFIYPQDRIKTHLQALADKKMNFFESFREILGQGGYKGFYKGFSYALMRAVPLHATAFMTMELCKKYL